MVDLVAMRTLVQEGHSRPLAWRKQQLTRLGQMLGSIEAELTAALASDLGKPALEAYLELVGVRQELAIAQRQLGRWMAPRRVAMPLVQMPGKAWVQAEPLGCVLILGPWNYPLMLVLQPLVAALAAGNTAVLKPSEHTPRVAQLIATAIAAHFEPRVVAVVQGDGAVAQSLLELSFDHIFFTGGTGIGRQVMAAAARQLIPVTLELGGKSPCIVLDDADLQVTAKRIAWGRFLNAGQTCIAPDYLLVTPAMRIPLERELIRAIAQLFGQDPSQSPDFGRLVNQRQFDRLDGLLQGAQILHGGERNREERYLAPTLVQGDPAQPLMQEEIFGPVLPMLEVADLEAALGFIRERPLPLALYLFGGNEASRQRLLNCSQSGSVCFNDVVMQAGIPELPFGGVGASGQGRYHGRSGFETLSNQRAVLQRPFALDLPWRYAPYGNRLHLLKRLLG
jgi:aldehyde dehydrogenase (NAD+)